VPDIPTGAAVSAVKAASKIKPWQTVRRHNRFVREEYEDLNLFANDNLQSEARALDGVKSDLAARGMLNSGAYGATLREVRDRHARQWTDRKREAERKFEELRENEGVTVRAWRKIKKSPWPENPEDENLRVITQAWEDETLRRVAVERAQVLPYGRDLCPGRAQKNRGTDTRGPGCAARSRGSARSASSASEERPCAYCSRTETRPVIERDRKAVKR
jgi:hypothetical protein